MLSSDDAARADWRATSECESLASTLQDEISRILKMFFTWMIDEGYSQIPIKKIKSIKSPGFDTSTTRPDEIPTQEEILSLVKVCKFSRDRALIMTLYESGCRIAELAALRWRDLQFDQYGTKMYITDEKNEKTAVFSACHVNGISFHLETGLWWRP